MNHLQAAVSVYNPDDLLDLLGLVIIGVFLVASAAVSTWISNRKMKQKVDEVHEQVRNSHPADRNLRDDIDQISEGVQHLHNRIDGLATRVDGIATRVDKLVH